MNLLIGYMQRMLNLANDYSERFSINQSIDNSGYYEIRIGPFVYYSLNLSDGDLINAYFSIGAKLYAKRMGAGNEGK